MAGVRNLYIGRAGQMAVMAEILLRGWNVALPEVDVGDDVFVVEDETGNLSRVQVKTATARVQKNGFSAQYRVALDQLQTPRTPDLIYIFAVREASRWGPFLVIDRSLLLTEHVQHGVGSVSGGSIVFRFVYQPLAVDCGRRSFLPFRDDWSRWRVLKHLAAAP